MELLFIWKVFVYLVRISSAERLDLLQRHGLVTGHADVLDVLGQDLYMSSKG